MRWLAFLPVLVLLTAGCGWQNLLLQGYASGNGPFVPAPIHRECLMVGPDGMPRPCRPKPMPGHVPGPPLVSCGVLGVGIGWRVSVSDTLQCRFAVSVMRIYFRGHRSVRSVKFFSCRPDSHGREIPCTTGSASVVAVANH
jgi:hypothetical protein